MANSNVNPHSEQLARALDRIGKAQVNLEEGRAGVYVSIVMLAKSAKESADADKYPEFVRHCMNVNADAKKDPNAVKAGWDFFSTIANEHKSPRADVDLFKLTAEAGTAGEDMDSYSRQNENSPIQQRVTAVKMGAAIVVRIDDVAADWNDIAASKNGESLWVGRNNNDGTMHRLFLNLKKEQSIRKSEEPQHTISGKAGKFRLTMLAQAGMDTLVAKGIKRKPNDRAANGNVVPRIAIANLATQIDKWDSKSMDAAGLSDDDVLLKLAMTTVNELSNGERKGFRISTKLAKEFLAAVEKERAAYDATFKAANKAAA